LDEVVAVIQMAEGLLSLFAPMVRGLASSLPSYLLIENIFLAFFI